MNCVCVCVFWSLLQIELPVDGGQDSSYRSSFSSSMGGNLISYHLVEQSFCYNHLQMAMRITFTTLYIDIFVLSICMYIIVFFILICTVVLWFCWYGFGQWGYQETRTPSFGTDWLKIALLIFCNSEAFIFFLLFFSGLGF